MRKSKPSKQTYEKNIFWTNAWAWEMIWLDIFIDKNIIRNKKDIDARGLDLQIQIFSQSDSVYLPFQVETPDTKTPSPNHSMKVEDIKLAFVLVTLLSFAVLTTCKLSSLDFCRKRSCYNSIYTALYFSFHFNDQWS